MAAQGTLPFEICRALLNHITTLTNGEISAAIRVLWESLRCVSEPSGAMLSLPDSCFEGLNIADFQYGLHHPDGGLACLHGHCGKRSQARGTARTARCGR